MDDQTSDVFDARLTSATLEHELRLVDEAIDAVSTGRFPRITVAGLRFGDEILDLARDRASAHGLIVRPMFHTGEHGADLVVERAPGPETSE